MEQLITDIAANGGLVAPVLAYFLYRNAKLTDVIVKLVENNTKAMTELAAAQKKRREEFE